MLKRTLATLLALLPVILTGCMDEDWSLCPPEDNLILKYSYPGEKGTDIFAEHIHAVDLLVFNQQLNLEGIYHTAKDSLNKFQGIRLALPPGQYTVVALGNPSPGTRSRITTFPDSTIDLDDGNGGLPLYYAPTPSSSRSLAAAEEGSVYTVVVPQKGTIEKTLGFKRAHRTISVLVKNYSHPQGGADPQLEVRFAHLAHLYDLQLQVAPMRMDYQGRTVSKETPDGIVRQIQINTPHQEIEQQIHITIATLDGELICPRINLREFLLSQNIPLDAASTGDIHILVSFSNGEVTLSLTDWKDNAVDPIW